jgi:hypothetical protein
MHEAIDLKEFHCQYQYQNIQLFFPSRHVCTAIAQRQ